MTPRPSSRFRRTLLKFFSTIGLATYGVSPVHALRAGEPSLTAKLSALQRAVHQVLEQPLVFHDPLALKIIDDPGYGEIKSIPRYHLDPAVRALRAALVARSRLAEDMLTEAYKTGIRQYIILGAGLDTFAYRSPYPKLRVFEVDDYATQLWKRKRLDDIGVKTPQSLQFVPIDFERQSLKDRLVEFGFRFDQPVFVSWLGVTMYLTTDAVFKTFEMIADNCVRGSSIVFDYLLPVSELRHLENVSRAWFRQEMERIGEPWISEFNTIELISRLHQMGFSSAQYFGPDQINAQYFSNRTDGLMVRGSSRLLFAKL